MLSSEVALVNTWPFRSPHHTVSTVTCTATITDPKGAQHQVIGTAQVNVYEPMHTEQVSPGRVGISDALLLLATGGNLYNKGITWDGLVTQPNGTTFLVTSKDQTTTNMPDWIRAITNL